MVDEDEDMITDEERLQIAQHFLLSSPPCQFHEVLADVKKILPDGLLTDPLAAGIARAHNVKTGRVVVTPDDTKVVLCKAGEIDPTHYVDSKSGLTISMDHLTLTAAAAADVEYNPDEALEPHRAAIQKAVNGYVSQRFVTDTAAGGAFSKDGKVAVVIVGEKPNLRNFWSGKWSSTWIVSVEGSTAAVTGEIKVHAHYFEDGNVQMQSTKAIPKKDISFTDSANLASLLTAHIKEADSAYHSGLDEMYGNMDEETFRAMRRIMPITRTKMDWNLSSVRMTRQIQRK
ncbi:unnamed protein product [Ectocarpus fasciculatus]